MNRVTPQMRDFARRLVAHDARKAHASDSLPAVFPVPAKLRPHLATLMGNSGYRALLLRALALATAELPWLQELRVAADGTLEGFAGLEPKPDPRKIPEAHVAVVARLMGLLVAFIGEKLTLGLVSEVWPELSNKDLNFNTGGRK